MLRAKPQGPRLLVKPVDATETMRNGIVLPVEASARERRGIVQDVGDGWHRELGEDGPVYTPLDVQPGEAVVFTEGAGQQVSLSLNEDGVYEDFLVLHMNDVLLILCEVESSVR